MAMTDGRILGVIIVFCLLMILGALVLSVAWFSGAMHP